VGGEHREGAAQRRHVLGLRSGDVLGRQHAAFKGAGQNAVAGSCRAGIVAIGAAALGRLRQGDQKSGFGRVQPARLLAQIGQRGRAHALDVAPIGRQRQV
jgi:hypothetical protein